jgi:two-component system, response regulator PdtaR
MTRALNVIVADDERDTREYLQELLSRSGHHVVAAQDGRELVELCRKTPPDLVIADVRMPELDGIAAAEAVNREHAVPFVLVTAHHDAQTLARAAVDPVMAYLVKPVKPADVESAVALALRRFERYEALRKESRDLRQALEDRKVIERAKGIIMRRLRVDEEDAFRRLRRRASDHNTKAAATAQEVVEADRLFRELEEL